VKSGSLKRAGAKGKTKEKAAKVEECPVSAWYLHLKQIKSEKSEIIISKGAL
jgi:hypothetical protein